MSAIPFITVIPSPEAYAWAAGVIDGEGCIRCSLRKKTRDGYSFECDLSISNIDPRMIVVFDQIFANAGGYTSQDSRRTYRRWPDKSTTRRRQVCYAWKVSSLGPVQEILRLVRPYLVIKGEEADAILGLQLRTQNGKKPIPRRLVSEGQFIDGRRLSPEERAEREAATETLRAIKKNRLSVASKTLGVLPN